MEAGHTLSDGRGIKRSAQGVGKVGRHLSTSSATHPEEIEAEYAPQAALKCAVRKKLLKHVQTRC